jgi:hypothetical protein
VEDVAVPRQEDGLYLLPIKKSVRNGESIEDGDVVSVFLDVGA